MIRKIVDWPGLDAMRQRAKREKWPAITLEELETLCQLTGVKWNNECIYYYQIVSRQEDEILLEMDVERSAREFIRAFQNLGLL